MNASLNELSPKLKNTSSGFTLIELMVTIAVLAIIAGIAAPNISTQLADQRVKSTAATIANALKEAKVESVVRRQNIRVVYNNTAKTIALQNTSGTVLATYNVNSKSTVSITPNTTTTVTFQPDKTTSNGTNVTYVICDSNSATTSRNIIVSTIASVSNKLGGIC